MRHRNASIREVMRSALLATAAVALGAVPAVAACTPNDVARFEGQWRGQGTFRQDEASAKEAIACRVVFSRAGEGRVSTRGRCATANETRAVSGHLACDGGKWSGPLFAAENAPMPRFLRDVSGEGETILLLEGQDPDTGQWQHYRLILTFPSKDALTVRIVRGPLTALDIRYRREAG